MTLDAGDEGEEGSASVGWSCGIASAGMVESTTAGGTGKRSPVKGDSG